MGKISKKKSKSNKADVGVTSLSCTIASYATDSAIVPRSTKGCIFCWICLDENHCSTEDPLVRDCSCGGSAGWGHLNCIIQYARQKSKEIGEGNIGDEVDWTNPFVHCPNCHQFYSRRLKKDLADELVSFVKTNNPVTHL